MNKIESIINVLIPDGDQVHALEVIRCLSIDKKIKIHVLSTKKWVQPRFSRYISSFTFFSPNLTEQETLEVIKQNILIKNIDILLPVYVNKIRFISKHRSFFQQLSKLIIPNLEDFDTANDKLKLDRFLEKRSINKPVTYEISEFDPTNKNINFPIILKPVYGVGGEGIKKVNNVSELISYKKRINSKEKYIIQHYIKGYDIDMSVLCKEGKILAFTIQKGILQRNIESFEAPIGIQFLFEERIYDLIKKTMTSLNWSGVAHIDLRYDSNENDFKIIEINPRYWGTLEGSKKVGVNFPYLHCLTSLGIDFKMPDFQHEKFIKKSGILKIIKSKISLKDEGYEFPKYSTIKSDILDPAPKITMAILKMLKMT